MTDSVLGMKKKVVNPDYYTKGIQPIDYIESWGMGYCEGNILKYITRYRAKDGKRDLEKARWYLDRLIEKIGSKSDYER